MTSDERAWWIEQETLQRAVMGPRVGKEELVVLVSQTALAAHTSAGPAHLFIKVDQLGRARPARDNRVPERGITLLFETQEELAVLYGRRVELSAPQRDTHGDGEGG